MKTKIFIGQKVNSKKGQGEIVRVITPSTGYVEVRLANGSILKAMAFDLTDEAGQPLKAKKVAKTAADDRTPEQKMADLLVKMASTDKRGSYQMYFGVVDAFLSKVATCEGLGAKIAGQIRATLNPFSFQVAKMSNKQAYAIACEAVKNNITL